jgi:hypothetical protein
MPRQVHSKVGPNLGVFAQGLEYRPPRDSEVRAFGQISGHLRKLADPAQYGFWRLLYHLTLSLAIPDLQQGRTLDGLYDLLPTPNARLQPPASQEPQAHLITGFGQSWNFSLEECLEDPVAPEQFFSAASRENARICLLHRLHL